MALIGIDLGTTNSLVCIYRDGKTVLIPNSLGEFLTPSAVSLEEDGSICVGAIAKERLVSRPEASVASFKRYMGTNRVFFLEGQSFTPQELSSFVLRQLKEDAERFLGEKVTEAVISVPAYFNDNQRYATKQAGKLAGIRVERLVNEPSAAALAASRISGKKEGSYLVFDFGGGTLDVSVVDYFDNVIEIIAVSGDNQLGGDDFDELIARKFCEVHDIVYEDMDMRERASLLRLSEECKRKLTGQKEAELVYGPEGKKFTLTIVMLAKMAQGIFDRIGQVISDALNDSSRTIEEIDEVVLVGGSAKMPVITFFLQTYLGKRPCVIGSPDEVVAAGAGIYAGIKERREEIKDLILTDICPFTLGTSVVNYSDRSHPVMSPLIERNSILPTSRTNLYTNAYDNQTHITIGVYQGESYYCHENIELGKIEMDILPMPEGKACFAVNFTYDINGILEVEVTDLGQNKKLWKVFTSGSVRVSEEELEQRTQEMQEYKLMPPGGIRTKLVQARGERLFRQFTGWRREVVASVMAQLQKGLAEKQNDQGIIKLVKEVEAAFDKLEGIER
ncbi:MAG: molecular chaperone HscC [Lachnospiraceae bacterium]|nr:molecular chaperone HscC [Lachnospiraceae bacterium]